MMCMYRPYLATGEGGSEKSHHLCAIAGGKGSNSPPHTGPAIEEAGRQVGPLELRQGRKRGEGIIGLPQLSQCL